MEYKGKETTGSTLTPSQWNKVTERLFSLASEIKTSQESKSGNEPTKVAPKQS
jgi:hypothetical protein